MLQLLLMFVAVIAVVVLPVKFAAGMVGAERTGFGFALVAAVVQWVFVAIVRWLLRDGLAQILAALIVGSAVYACMLGTSVVKGFVISIVATVIAVVAILILGTSFALVVSAA